MLPLHQPQQQQQQLLLLLVVVGVLSVLLPTC
jgi:hypothetical protein